ncbi:hypothetical protein J8J19_20930, partial [Mycobacterium tuberculosis]|nr:hypothetical protein [Mycobacterium tuberculosis]
MRGVDVEANVAFTQSKTLADAANPTYVDKTWPRMPRVRAVQSVVGGAVRVFLDGLVGLACP